MDKISKLDVFYHDRIVGTMALYQGRVAAFAYDESWLSDGFSISPLSLPLEKKVFMPQFNPFDGIHGVFADSLPDGWGRLLADRFLQQNGVDPFTVGSMERLAIVGSTGMGALTYRPAMVLSDTSAAISIEEAARACEIILKKNSSKIPDTLFTLGGSSGGARPKILTKVDGDEWIIKFPSSDDAEDIGEQEYDYMLCAKECGLETQEVRLFSGKKRSYFGVRRFDRMGEGEQGKVHMVSVSGLLETSHRIPNLDYNLLMRLTLQLTKSMAECEKLFSLMCFNVFAHNRDDHSKNFSYLYNEKEDCWTLSPVYDLTYSSSVGGEHATCVNGNGANPGLDDVLMVAEIGGLKKSKSKKTALQIRDCVQEMLGEYLK